MKKKLGLVLLGVISLIFSSLVYADNQEGNITFTLGEGWIHFADSRRFDNTGVPFAGLSYNLSRRFAVEALLGIFHTKSNNPIDTNQHVNGTLFALDVIYRFKPCGVLEPYILAGPGAFSMSPNGTDAHTEGNVNAGIGTQIFIDKMIAFRLEARDYYTIVGSKNEIMLDGAVSFLFGQT